MDKGEAIRYKGITFAMLVKKRRERVGDSPGSAVTESLADIDLEASTKEPVLAVTA